jgi:hypothetical protein
MEGKNLFFPQLFFQIIKMYVKRHFDFSHKFFKKLNFGGELRG